MLYSTVKPKTLKSRKTGVNTQDDMRITSLSGAESFLRRELALS
jgi:hypothetical protein